MDSERRQHLENLLKIHRDNLSKLEVQAAQYSKMDIPTHLYNRIKNEQEDIVQIEAQLENGTNVILHTLSKHRGSWLIYATLVSIAVILAIVSYIGGRGNAIADVQPTVEALQTIVAATPRVGAATQLIVATPTFDDNVLRLQQTPIRVISYEGGDSPEVQGKGWLSIVYDELGLASYTLKYSLPSQALTWSGIAMLFDEPRNIAQYQYIEVRIKFSDPEARCEIKIVDKTDNTEYFRLGVNPDPKSGVNITNIEGWQVIKVPLRINFDNVNLEQIKEITFATSSNISTGDHSFTISDVKLTRN